MKALTNSELAKALNINAGETKSLFFENNMFNAGIIAVQGLGVLTAFAWGFGVALIVFKVLDLVLGGLRVSKQHEQRGLDYTEHAELSYPEFQRDVTFETDDMTKRH